MRVPCEWQREPTRTAVGSLLVCLQLLHKPAGEGDSSVASPDLRRSKHLPAPVPGTHDLRRACREVNVFPMQSKGFAGPQACEAQEANQCSFAGTRGTKQPLDLFLGEGTALDPTTSTRLTAFILLASA